jgi:hypothetical protein
LVESKLKLGHKPELIVGTGVSGYYIYPGIVDYAVHLLPDRIS